MPPSNSLQDSVPHFSQAYIIGLFSFDRLRVCKISGGAVAVILFVTLGRDTTAVALLADYGLASRQVPITRPVTAETITTETIAKLLRCCV